MQIPYLVVCSKLLTNSVEKVCGTICDAVSYNKHLYNTLIYETGSRLTKHAINCNTQSFGSGLYLKSNFNL